MALLLQAIVAVRGENSTNTKCEDGWSDETSVGLGCILADKRAVFNFAQANEYCKAQDSRLIELVTELQMKHVSNLLKNVSRSKPTDQWWGGAVQVGPEQDRNWTWIESGAPVQDWAWGANYPGNFNDRNNFIFQLFQDVSGNLSYYYGRDVREDSIYYPVCQKPMPTPTTTPATINTTDPTTDINGKDSGEADTVPLIAGISAGVVIIVIVVAVIAYTAYWHYHDKKVWARTGGRRPPKFGPSTDYCDGYYGDDRPRRRGLNEVEEPK